MGAIREIGIVALIGIAVVSGQALLMIFARSIPAPLTFRQVAAHALVSPALYGAVITYALGVMLYVWRLRRVGLTEMNLGVMVSIVACTMLYDLALGNPLTLKQYLGAVLAAVGLVLLQ